MRARTDLLRELPAVAGLIVACTFVLLVLAGPGYLNFDAVFGLLWGREAVAPGLPDYRQALAPSPHPLVVLWSAPVAVLGTAAGYVAQQAAGMLWWGALAAALVAVGRRAGSTAGGVLAALLLLSAPRPLLDALTVRLDVAFAALVLWAVVYEIADRRRPRLALALLAAAGLLRPEAWALAVAYALSLWLRDRSLAPLRLGAMALAGPVVWVLTDLLVTGDPVYTVRTTRGLAEARRPTGLGEVPGTLRESLDTMLGVAPAILGAVVAVLVLSRGRRSGHPRLVVAALAAAGLLGFVALGVLGLPLIDRYLLLPAAALALLAGLAATGAVEVPGLPRPLVGAVAAVVLAVALVDGADQAREIHRLVDGRATQLADLRELSTRTAVRDCPVVWIDQGRFVGAGNVAPEVAWRADRPTATLTTDAPAGAAALLTLRPAPPPGWRSQERRGAWTLAVRGCGT